MNAHESTKFREEHFDEENNKNFILPGLTGHPCCYHRQSTAGTYPLPRIPIPFKVPAAQCGKDNGGSRIFLLSPPSTLSTRKYRVYAYVDSLFVPFPVSLVLSNFIPSIDARQDSSMTRCHEECIIDEFQDPSHPQSEGKAKKSRPHLKDLLLSVRLAVRPTE